MGDPSSSFRRRRVLAILKTVLTQATVIAAAAVAIGAFLAAVEVMRPYDPAVRPASADIVLESATQDDVHQASSPLEATRVQLDRATQVLQYANRYRIPADLSAAIYDMAVAERIHPALGFQLVRVESRFKSGARSHKGAIGYTQVRIGTARGYLPELTEEHLEDRDVNLRIGFRYLRDMLKRFKGDLDLALVAYNRGPTLVDSLIAAGDDPANGYSTIVRRGLSRAASRTPMSGS